MRPVLCITLVAVAGLPAASADQSASEDAWSTDGAFTEVAATPDGAGDTIEESGLARVLPDGMTVRGAIRYENFTYFEKLSTKNNGRNSGEAFLEARYQGGPFTLHAAGRARRDFSDDQRNVIEPGEVYLEINKSPVNVRAGRFLVTWGRGTLSSPVDIINPVDTRDPLAREKLPTYVARTSLVLGPATLEGYYLPVAEANRIPSFDGVDQFGQLYSNSRWIDDEMLAGGMERFELMLGQPPRASLNRPQGAARLTASGHGFDIAIGWARLYDRTPIIRMTRDPNGFMPTRVAYDYRPVNYITLEAERAFGKLRVVSEGLITLTENFNNLEPDPDIEQPSYSGMVGADYRTDEFFTNHYLRFFLEYNFASGIDTALARDPLAFARRPFLYQFLARAQYDAGENLHLYVQGAAAPTRYDALIQPGLSYTFRDMLTVAVQASILRGSGYSSFYGRFAENSRISSSVEWKF